MDLPLIPERLRPYVAWPIAAVVPVLAANTIYRGLTGQWERHKRIARITFPIWLYVSVTGVIIYAMLYHWPRG